METQAREAGGGSTMRGRRKQHASETKQAAGLCIKHLREVQVDDQVHGRDIEPAGRHVSGHEHPRGVAFEGGQRGRALGLDRGASVDGWMVDGWVG